MSTTFILWTFVSLAFIQVAVQFCYNMNLLSYKKTDTKNYRLSMEIHNNNTVSSLTTVYKEIPIPMWHLTLMQRSHSHQKMHYNGTIRVCDFWKFVKRVRVFREVTSVFMQPESGNLSLDCPMLPGRYVLHNMMVPPDSNFLKFIYSPNSMYTLYGTILSLLPNKRMDKLCTYEINATITRMC